MTRYRHVPDTGQILAPGEVVGVGGSPGIAFKCPCGERTVHVTEPPHTITYDDDGLLTLDGSVGSREDPHRGRPKLWCHFWIKAGEATMAGDTQCPGKALLDSGGSG